MAKNHKMTRQELKQDEFKDFSEHIAEWFQNHSTAIGTVITAGLVIFAAYMLYGNWTAKRELQASAEYTELIKNYSAALNTPEENLKEKVNTTVLAADRIIENYGNMPVARNARLLKGNVRYYEALALDPAKIDNPTSAAEFMTRRDEAFKAAREAFDQALASAVLPADKAEARLALAQAQESLAFLNNDKQLVADAIGNYTAAATLQPGTWLAAEAALGLGRMMQAQKGKEKEAADLYASVAKDRALPEMKPEEGSRAPKDAKGNEVPQDVVNELRNRSKISYQALAQKLESALASEAK